MKAGFALIPDLDTRNAVAALAWDLHVRHGADLGASRIPPHVSLKQPFDAPALPELLAYLDAFAATIRPMTAAFAGSVVWPWPSAADPRSGVLVLKVLEQVELRTLHTRLNAELAARFGARSAPFDGDAYSFHLTVSAGGPGLDAYERIAAGLGSLPSSCRLESLALFLFDQAAGSGDWDYMTYRTIPLT